MQLIIIVALIIIICIISRIVWNLYNKNVILEDWVISFSMRMQEVTDECERLDHMGAFKSDDEVGFFFIRFKEIIDTLKDFHLIDEDMEGELHDPKKKTSSLLYTRDGGSDSSV